MRLFTILVGMATLISLALQLSGPFEETPQILWYSTTFLGGVTLGLTLTVVFSPKFAYPVEFKARQFLGFLLYSTTGLLVFILFLLGALLEDQGQRADAQKLGSAVSGFLIFLLLFFLNSFFGEPSRHEPSASDDVELLDEENEENAL